MEDPDIVARKAAPCLRHVAEIEDYISRLRDGLETPEHPV